MNTTLNIRIDKKMKTQIAKKFADMGLDLSSGTKLMYDQFLKEAKAPLRVIKDPKKIRAKWDREAAWALKHGKAYRSAKELHDDILK